MRTNLNIQNSTVILRNMTAYWIWHHFISINAVRLTNSALNLVGASPVSTSEISDELRIGLSYMATIGLCYRLSLAIAKTNNSRTGMVHGAFTYLYNQTYVGIYSNKQTLNMMMWIALIHRYCFNDQNTNVDNSITKFLFSIVMSTLVGAALDKLNSVIPFRELVVDRMKGLQLIANCCIWGGMTNRVHANDPKKDEAEMTAVAGNIHYPLPSTNESAILRR